MPWFRIDDDLPQHVKMDALEAAAGSWEIYAAARTVWEDMGCDCSRRRTDGRFARARALRVCRLPPDVIDRALAALVTAGFLEVDGGEYRYHDWSDYQPTKAELDEQRKAATERQRKRRMGLSQRDTAVTHAATTAVTSAVSHEASRRESQGESRPASHERGASTSAVRVTAPRPVPSRPVSDSQNSERAGDGVPPPRPTQPRVPRLEADELPPTEPLARAIYDAIRGDAFLCPVTRLPADLASRMTAPGAFPGVNVLGQVLRAAAWNAGQRKKKRDGRAFLLGWVGRADPEAPTDSGVYDIPAPTRPAAPPVPRVLGVPVANPVKAGAANALLETLRAQGTHDASR